MRFLSHFLDRIERRCSPGAYLRDFPRAYCLQATLEARLKTLAGGAMPREAMSRLKTMQW